ncbi:MAG TPA: ABC transporter permease [Syntrophobacteraceae bacterium]|nr:ABC transporter permease [Syntrophobacteraceae bacterium]
MKAAITSHSTPFLKKALDSRLLGHGVVVLGLVGWQALSLSGWVDSNLFPSIGTIGASLFRLSTSFELIHHVLDSIQRILIGFLLGSAVGYLLGFICGLSDSTYGLLEMSIEFLRPIPSVILIPIAILFLGIGNLLNVGVIAWACSWPVFVNTMDGVRSVDNILLNTARMLGLNYWAIVREIYMPASLPQVLTGLRVGLGIAVAVGVITEMVVSATGIGSFILGSSLSFRVPEMYAGVVTVGLLGYLLNRVFVIIERHASKWNKGRSVSTS